MGLVYQKSGQPGTTLGRYRRGGLSDQASGLSTDQEDEMSRDPTAPHERVPSTSVSAWGVRFGALQSRRQQTSSKVAPAIPWQNTGVSWASPSHRRRRHGTCSDWRADWSWWTPQRLVGCPPGTAISFVPCRAWSTHWAPAALSVP